MSSIFSNGERKFNNSGTMYLWGVCYGLDIPLPVSWYPLFSQRPLDLSAVSREGVTLSTLGITDFDKLIR